MKAAYINIVEYLDHTKGKTCSTILFATMIPTATAKLNVRATDGPQNRCCWRLAPSELCISLYRELRSSSSARPVGWNKIKFSQWVEFFLS
jgi:hypothetical protein